MSSIVIQAFRIHASHTPQQFQTGYTDLWYRQAYCRSIGRAVILFAGMVQNRHEPLSIARRMDIFPG